MEISPIIDVSLLIVDIFLPILYVILVMNIIHRYTITNFLLIPRNSEAHKGILLFARNLHLYFHDLFFESNRVLRVCVHFWKNMHIIQQIMVSMHTRSCDCLLWIPPYDLWFVIVVQSLILWEGSTLDLIRIRAHNHVNARGEGRNPLFPGRLPLCEFSYIMVIKCYRGVCPQQTEISFTARLYHTKLNYDVRPTQLFLLWDAWGFYPSVHRRGCYNKRVSYS